jgi:hypothetical protein
MWSLLAISLFERFSSSASRTSFSRRERPGRAGRPPGRPDRRQRLVDEPREERARDPEPSRGDLLDRPRELLRGLGEREEPLGAEAQQREGGALLELLRDEHDARRRLRPRTCTTSASVVGRCAWALHDVDGGLRDREAFGVRHQVRLEPPDRQREVFLGQQPLEFREHERMKGQQAHRCPAG